MEINSFVKKVRSSAGLFILIAVFVFPVLLSGIGIHNVVSHSPEEVQNGSSVILNENDVEEQVDMFVFEHADNSSFVDVLNEDTKTIDVYDIEGDSESVYFAMEEGNDLNASDIENVDDSTMSDGDNIAIVDEQRDMVALYEYEKNDGLAFTRIGQEKRIIAVFGWIMIPLMVFVLLLE